MSHPYHELEAMPAWKIVDEAISALVANQDIKEATDRCYIVGYLIKCLVEAGAIEAKAEE